MESPPAVSNEKFFSAAYQPSEIARRVATMGVAKARAPALTLLVLALLAGAFISLGALLYAFVASGSTLGFGITRFLGGLGFSTREMLRNWLIVYIGNVLGCIGTVMLVHWSNLAAMNDGRIGEAILQIASDKSNLTTLEALTRGVLCNVLVCLAVWLAMGGRSVTDKILAVMLPVAAFVTMGFEHSIANWFFLPYGLLLDESGALTMAASLHNLVMVTAGNVAGGTLLVAGIYWLAYLRPEQGTEK